jgi:S1-C subfamily serine protease
MQNLEKKDISALPYQYSQPEEPSLPPALSKRPRHGPRTAAIVALTLLLAIVFGTGLFAGWEFGSRNAGTGTSSTTIVQSGTDAERTIPPLTKDNAEAVREAVIAKVRPAVVQVNITTQSSIGLGSGVIIDRRGYIITNNHVIDGAQKIEVVLSDGTKIQAQPVGKDQALDLAVLKVPVPGQNLTVAALGDSSQLRVGQEVLAIGNPLGITQTVTQGIVSALRRNVSTFPDVIQTDAPINPGNSGGALVDMQGKVVGIPTFTAIDPEFKMPANGVGFAIPSNRVRVMVSQLIAGTR